MEGVDFFDVPAPTPYDKGNQTVEVSGIDFGLAWRRILLSSENRLPQEVVRPPSWEVCQERLTNHSA